MDKFLVRASLGILFLAAAYYSRGEEFVLISAAGVGGLLIGAAVSDYNYSKTIINCAAIAVAAKKVGQAYMTPQASCVSELQELCKVLYMTGWQPGKK